MMSVRAMAAGRPLPRVAAFAAITEFPLEWLGVLAIGFIDAVWAARTGFAVSIGWFDLLAMLGILAAAILLRARRSARAATIAEYFVLTIVSASAFAILSYLCMALSLPLIDHDLMRFDRALGFDWLYWFNQLQRHPVLLREMYFAYASMPYQGIYFIVLFGMLRDRARLCEMFWIVFVASALTTLVCTFVPALGTFDSFHLGDLGGYLSDIHRLREGGNRHFDWEHLTGIITFPSFHTSMALIYIYAFRRMGWVSVLMTLLNLAMLPAIPFIGGHYLADMLGGVLVAVIAIAIVRTTPQLRLMMTRRFEAAAGSIH
jgi:hypothetical protein